MMIFKQEMDCLEENFKELGDKCKEVVKKFVEEEDEVPELSQIFMKACEPILKDHCKVHFKFFRVFHIKVVANIIFITA